MIFVLLGMMLGTILSVGCFIFVPKIRHRARLGPSWHEHTDRLLDEAECCAPSEIRANGRGADHGVVIEIGDLKLVAGSPCEVPALEYANGDIPLTDEQKSRVRRIVMDKLANRISAISTDNLLGTWQEESSQET